MALGLFTARRNICTRHSVTNVLMPCVLINAWLFIIFRIMNQSHKNNNHLGFDAYCRKRISFIVQTKNHALFLDKALSEWRGWKKPEDEIIVIDGASEDSTKDVVEKNRNIIDIFISEPDINGCHAQNKGMLLASGKYIKQLGDDDIYYPEAIEKAVEIMEEYPEIDLLLCGGTKEQDGRTWASCVPPGANYGKSTKDVFQYGCASGVGHFIRRSSLAKLGILLPLRQNADVAFVLDIIKRGSVVKFCRINSYHHPLRSAGATLRNKFEHRIDTNRLVREHCSLRFYIYYRLREFLKEFSLGRKIIMRSIRKSKRILKIIISGKGDPHSEEKVEVVWDGGFS